MGILFLPVKASIRKEIKKQAGDYVHIILFEDSDKMGIPEEFYLCLKDEPQAYKNFKNLEENEQKKYLDWIYSVKKDDTKVERMAKIINELVKGRAK